MKTTDGNQQPYLRAPRPIEPGEATGGVSAAGVPRVVALGALLALLAVANLLVVIPRLPAPDAPSVALPWWLLALAFAASEIWVIHFPFRRQAHTFSMSEIPLLLGLFLTTPTQLVTAQLVGAGLAMAVYRRQGPIKTFYNVSHFALASTVAWVVLHTALASTDAWSLAGMVAAVGATVAAGLVETTAVSAAIVLSGDRVVREELGETTLFSIINAIANASTGLMILALLFDGVPFTGYLAIAPALMMLLAYAGYSRQRETSATLGLLYEASHDLQRAEGLHGVVETLLPRTRAQLRAERAELTLFAGEGRTAVRAIADEDGCSPPQPLERATKGEAQLRHLMELRGPVRARPGTDGDPLAEYARIRGWQDAIAVPLAGSAETFGALVVANREGEIDSFSQGDLDLLASLAGTAAALLERDRLGASLDELMALQQQLVELTTHDTLTGLCNRACLMEDVRQALANDGQPTAIIVLDVEGLGDINASHGAAVGDEALKIIAARVTSAMRNGDVAARIGGARFAVLVPSVDDVDLVHGLATMLRTSLARNVTLDDGYEFALRCDIGVALDVGRDGVAEELVSAAELAARHARRSPTATYVPFREDMRVESRRRLAVASALRHMVSTGEGLATRYQPIVELASGHVVGLEALARWTHPDLGDVSPGEFLPVAERHGLMPEIGRRVLTAALEDAASWQSLTDRPVGLTVNLSTSQLGETDLLTDFDDALRRHGLAPELLTIDIDAEALRREQGALRATLEQLHRFGVHLALDDVGMGAHSLDLVDEVPVDVIKLDRGLTSNVRGSRTSRAVLRSLIDLGHELRLPLVAEGVEEPGQLDALRELGAEQAQGYLVAPPLEAEAVTVLLRALAGRAPADATNVIRLHERSA